MANEVVVPLGCHCQWEYCGRPSPAIAHVDALARQHIAGARVAVHVAGQHQVHLVLRQQGLDLAPQVLCAA